MTGKKDVKVLVVDDDYLAREKIKQLVETIDYTVIGEATDGQQAIELAESLRPDVILMDIQMPRMGGLEATRAIQKRCPTPVVILTAFQTPDLVEQASTAGVGAYLVKPPTARAIERNVTIAVARFDDMMKLRQLNERLKDEILTRQRIEQELVESLNEKKLLLQEIHHRVKNNLMVISSLLNLQADAIEDAQARTAFEESQSRVQAMARIHEQLYQSENLAQIDMNLYIRALGSSLRHSYGAYSINLKIEVADVFLSINTAIPCGLIVNELISNALKYAFPTQPSGQIWITLGPTTQGRLRLVVSDNGVGLPSNVDPQKTQTLGLQLVRLLALQLEGTFRAEQSRNGRGTIFTVTFQP